MIIEECESITGNVKCLDELCSALGNCVCLVEFSDIVCGTDRKYEELDLKLWVREIPPAYKEVHLDMKQ